MLKASKGGPRMNPEGIRRTAVLFFSLIATALGVSIPAHAQQVPSVTSTTADRYEYAIGLGVEEFERGNFEEARTRFAEAHAAQPNARTLRGLGMVEYELKHYLVAVQHLRKSLTAVSRPLDEAQRAQVEELITLANAYLGTLDIELAPEQATLLLDGEHVRLNGGQIA